MPIFQPSMAKSSSSLRARSGRDAGSLPPKCFATPIRCMHRRFMDKHDRRIKSSVPRPPQQHTTQHQHNTNTTHKTRRQTQRESERDKDRENRERRQRKSRERKRRSTSQACFTIFRVLTCVSTCSVYRLSRTISGVRRTKKFHLLGPSTF